METCLQISEAEFPAFGTSDNTRQEFTGYEMMLKPD